MSASEADLIEAMQRVQYGELFGVEVAPGEGQLDGLDLPAATRDLLLTIRSGVQYIDVLTVHNGQPTQAETDCKILGFRCRIKIKFPTVSER